MSIAQKYLFVCFSFIVFSCSSTPLSRFDYAEIPADFFGIVHAGDTGTAEEYLLLDELGANWVLNTFYWESIEREKDHFDFSHYDNYVDTAKREGKKIIAVLGYETAWLFPERKQKRFISRENIPLFLRFVAEMVQHFKGRVDVWQVWNEPNIPRFWQGSKKVFFELSSLTTLKIKETDPDAYILGGGFSLAPRWFTRGMHKAGALENLDGISFHPYGINPSHSMKVYDKFLNILSEIKYSKPIWITEVGFPTGGWYPTRVSLEKYPSYIIKTITGAAARGPQLLLWYHMFDSRNKGEISRFFKSSEKFFGLVYPDYSRKDGAWAYELCAAFLPGSTYISNYIERVNIPKTIISLCFLEGKSGFNTLVLWNDKSGSSKINLYLPAPAYLHDISNGEKTPLQEETMLSIGKTPLFITWQGEDVPRLVMIK